MKIDDYHQNVNLMESAREGAPGHRTEDQGVQTGETEKRDPGGGTQVALSSASREVVKTREAMETPEPERAQKVAELKKQIAEGTYEADAQKVADRILETAISDLL